MQPEFQPIPADSNKYLENINVQDLCDLLVVKTSELLTTLHQKGANGFKVRDLKLEVEKIQAAIKLKKLQNGTD